MLQRQAPGALGRVLRNVAQAIRDGSSFSDALREHPDAFPPIFARMVAVGERTGNLDVVLRQLASHIDKEQAIIKRVRGAMAYPAFVMLLAVGVVIIVITMALPPLISLFDEFNASLPLPTRILLAVSGFATAYLLHMTAALALAVGAGILYARRPAGRRQIDHALLRMPLIGPITVLTNAARFCGTTSILLRAGIPVAEVMDLAIHTTENRTVRAGLREVREEMLRGEGLSKPLANSKLFPPMLVQMVEVGEETGTLDNNLETMADFYTREVDSRIGMLTGMIQPAMTLGVGLIVAFVAISIIMPMYDIMQSVRQP
jgi:type IV pilus assembly protein PilC